MDKYFPHVSVDAGSAPFWTHERKWERRHHRHQAKKACKEMAKHLDLELIEDDEYHQSRVPGNTWYPADYLSPFYRWLEKSIGKPWDRVYSEFCKFVPQHNLRGDHLHSHLWAEQTFGAVHRNFTNVEIRMKNASGFWYYIDDDGILRRHEKKWEGGRWPSTAENQRSVHELVQWGGGFVADHPIFKKEGGFYPLKRKMLKEYWGEVSSVNWIDRKAYYRQTKTKITKDDLMKLNSYDKSFHFIIKA